VRSAHQTSKLFTATRAMTRPALHSGTTFSA
jgi:hypothetical protein